MRNCKDVEIFYVGRDGLRYASALCSYLTRFSYSTKATKILPSLQQESVQFTFARTIVVVVTKDTFDIDTMSRLNKARKSINERILIIPFVVDQQLDAEQKIYRTIFSDLQYVVYSSDNPEASLKQVRKFSKRCFSSHVRRTIIILCITVLFSPALYLVGKGLRNELKNIEQERVTRIELEKKLERLNAEYEAMKNSLTGTN